MEYLFIIVILAGCVYGVVQSYNPPRNKTASRKSTPIKEEIIFGAGLEHKHIENHDLDGDTDSIELDTYEPYE